MTRLWRPLAAFVVVLTLTAGPLRAGGRELRTVEAATEVIHSLSGLWLRDIPPSLLAEAKGVAIIPDVIKAGFLVGGRFGRGVILVRQPDGCWSNPIFITLAGGGVGWQIGVQATDLVLVFKTRSSLDRVLKGKGKLTLGADVAVAAGPVGRQAEAGTDVMLRAEIYSYSRSRGLFAGLSVEGAGLLVDGAANEAFYGVSGSPADLVGLVRVPPIAAVDGLKGELTRLSGPPAPPVFIVPPQTASPRLAPPTTPLPPPPPVPVPPPLPGPGGVR
jgi:lipid-binding SYLF domain-containing protein